MDTIKNAFYVRTVKGEKSTANDSCLERRSLILLRLIDGVTPLSTFENHLSHFDIPRLFNELLSAGLITQVMQQKYQSNPSKSFGFQTTGSDNPAHNTSGAVVTPVATKQKTEDTALDSTTVDNVTAAFMKRYVKNVSNDDPDIQRSIAERRAISPNSIGWQS